MEDASNVQEREIIVRALTPELEVEDPDYGTELPRGFKARIADSPIGIPIRKLLRERGVPTPRELKLYKNYELYLIPHRVSVVQHEGLSEVTSIGLSIKYLNGRKTCSVVSLLPEFEFVELGSLRFRCAVNAHGEAAPPPETVEQLVQVPGTKLEVGISAGTSASIVLEGNVTTPKISAVGKGGRECEWLFKRERAPLIGKDIETWSVVVLPEGRQKQLDYEITLNLSRRTAFFPTRWQSDPVQVHCLLLDPDA